MVVGICGEGVGVVFDLALELLLFGIVLFLQLFNKVLKPLLPVLLIFHLSIHIFNGTVLRCELGLEYGHLFRVIRGLAHQVCLGFLEKICCSVPLFGFDIQPGLEGLILSKQDYHLFA